MGKVGYDCRVLTLVITVIGVVLLVGSCNADLEMDFYAESCPKAEQIVYDYVNRHIPNAPSLAASLIRMHFHDCFVRGCDASVLLDYTAATGNQTEKVATPNQTVRGFDFIDRVKDLLEDECPGVVSCADIITLVARDAIVAIGGPFWRVPTGRRDGVISNASEALDQIPAPSSAHTIGISHCASFANRLYNFTGAGDEDPSLDNEYAANLKAKKCKSIHSTAIVDGSKKF
ncbi:UNVERIFIED_CONTAM: Peroxidase 39 [Sesamum angustifolium]|uniref:peroxidase n=1 Tax=Sesamum angustifolium TaxID=2727405 RepID=A0AAW2IP02_9LAMI